MGNTATVAQTTSSNDAPEEKRSWFSPTKENVRRKVNKVPDRLVNNADEVFTEGRLRFLQRWGLGRKGNTVIYDRFMAARVYILPGSHGASIVPANTSLRKLNNSKSRCCATTGVAVMSDDSDVDSQNSDVDDTYDADTSSQGSRGSSPYLDPEKISDEIEVENNLGDQVVSPEEKEEHSHGTGKGSDAGSTSERTHVEEEDNPGSSHSETGSVRTADRDSRAGSAMSGDGRTDAARDGGSSRPASKTRAWKLEKTGERRTMKMANKTLVTLEINIFSGSSFDAEGEEGAGCSRQGSMVSLSADGERGSAGGGAMSLRPPSSESDRRFLEVRPTGQGDWRPPQGDSRERHRSESLQSATQDSEGENPQEQPNTEENLNSKRSSSRQSETTNQRRPSSGKSETSLQQRPLSAESENRKRRRKSGSKTSVRSDGDIGSRILFTAEDKASSRPSSGRSTSSKKVTRPGSVASGQLSIKSLPVEGNADRPTVNRPRSADMKGRHAEMDRSGENTDGEDDTTENERREEDEKNETSAGNKSKENDGPEEDESKKTTDADTRHSRRSLHSAKSTRSFRSIASTRLDYLAELADIKDQLEAKAADWDGLGEEHLEVFLEELRELYGRTTAVLRSSHRDSVCLMERIVQVRKLLKETRRKLRDETSDRTLCGMDEKVYTVTVPVYTVYDLSHSTVHGTFAQTVPPHVSRCPVHSEGW
ncbi:Death domain-containing protein 1 [Branchiostoma belcheri]|nr:Death domain-containing protein 1 [Branchiostoma belcheri]